MHADDFKPITKKKALEMIKSYRGGWEKYEYFSSAIHHYYKYALNDDASYLHELTYVGEDFIKGEGSYKHCSVCDTEYYYYEIPTEYLWQPDKIIAKEKAKALKERKRKLLYEIKEAKRILDYRQKAYDKEFGGEDMN